MPRISEFYGIVILMYWFDTKRHKKPHFHARYRGAEAVFDLSGRPLAGRLPSTAEKLINHWCQINEKELRIAWRLAAKGKELPWIKPLQ